MRYFDIVSRLGVIAVALAMLLQPLVTSTAKADKNAEWHLVVTKPTGYTSLDFCLKAEEDYLRKTSHLDYSTACERY